MVSVGSYTALRGNDEQCLESENARNDVKEGCFIKQFIHREIWSILPMRSIQELHQVDFNSGKKNKKQKTYPTPPPAPKSSLSTEQWNH